MNSVLLTIDDVPSGNTPALVAYLKEKSIQPILFAVGKNIETHYQEALYAVKQGFILGNHSYSHPSFSSLSLEECIKEIEKCEDILETLHHDAGMPRIARPFRFPYGDKGGANKAALQQYMQKKQLDKADDRHIPYAWWKEFGMNQDIDTFWTFDFEEYRITKDPNFTVQQIWDKINNPNPPYGAALFAENHRHFLLMHDFDETNAALPGYYRIFLDYLLEKGVIFDKPEFLSIKNSSA